MMGAESKETAASMDAVEDDLRQIQLQSRDEEESSPILTMQNSKNLETCPSCESNSTEDCTVADDDIFKNAILSQLEQKRLALRNQRFSLEKRLYEFGTHYSINTNAYTTKPNRQVQDSKFECHFREEYF
jgi:thiamine pyrophosphokinase